ncbi:hypothetical protein ATANTOWER_020845 [Ataeniobius toweri]|uniref:Cytochrome c biogenesis B n=1 Tax=Ataeniobius toweri TaxID=208326 RepID=A0ABU7A243_9TELE|nr:hypothetical protein [Ataeniobius toweri]
MLTSRLSQFIIRAIIHRSKRPSGGSLIPSLCLAPGLVVQRVFKSQEISLTPFFSYYTITAGRWGKDAILSVNIPIHPSDFITLHSCQCLAVPFPPLLTKR